MSIAIPPCFNIIIIGKAEHSMTADTVSSKCRSLITFNISRENDKLALVLLTIIFQCQPTLTEFLISHSSAVIFN